MKEQIKIDDLPFTPIAKNAIAKAKKIADSHEHCIGPEHLFMALISEPKGIVQDILTDHGINVVDLRDRALSLSKHMWRSVSDVKLD